jgi:hypothetical protein
MPAAQSIKGPAFRRSTLELSRLKSDDDVEIRRIGQALQCFQGRACVPVLVPRDRRSSNSRKLGEQLLGEPDTLSQP